MKFARSVVLDQESITAIEEKAYSQKLNFSQALNMLIHQSAYLFKKIEVLKREQEEQDAIVERINRGRVQDETQGIIRP
jgi:hypothetical protein